MKFQSNNVLMKLYGSPQTREKQSFSVSAPLQNTANLSPVKTSKYDNRAEQCEITWENITVVRYDEVGGGRLSGSPTEKQQIHTVPFTCQEF